MPKMFSWIGAIFFGLVYMSSWAAADESIVIRSPVHLHDALLAAEGGEEFVLAEGQYGHLQIDNKEFEEPVTIRSQIEHRARFQSISVTATTGMDFSGLHIDNGSNGSQTAPLFLVTGGSQNIGLSGSMINAKRDDDFTGYVGVIVNDGAQNITIHGNIIQDVRRGAIFEDSRDLRITGNRIDRIGDDSLKFIGVRNVTISHNIGAKYVFPEPGAHLDFIQFQGRSSSDIAIHDNVSLPFNSGAALVQGIFFDDAHFTDVVIENNIIITGMIRGISLSSGTNVVARHNTVLDVQGIGSKATKVLVQGEVYNNVFGSFPNDKELGENTNLVLQQADPGMPWHYDEFFANGTAGLGLTVDDLSPVSDRIGRDYGADVERILNGP